ncbi:MAG: Holliday junction branch migration protein RuvA [Patescibacteria group bacterium]|nr:Holliday junction branch migration protein RuvA [Patescibacteria group bacterium]MCL5224136.1 Holliday junction branch migration protein RuvA [Patescibacteria group bacterium]
MIDSVSGILKVKDLSFAVVEVGGVGLKVFISLRTRDKLPAVGQAVSLATHLHVREDALELFGFADAAEQDCFQALISVSGIGPRLAMALLSAVQVDDIVSAIAEGKVDLLDRAPGIGHKTAERIVLELKDRMKLLSKGGSAKAIAAMEADDDVYYALRSLGYSQSQARQIMAKIDPELKDVGDRLRDALKKMKG